MSEEPIREVDPQFQLSQPLTVPAEAPDIAERRQTIRGVAFQQGSLGSTRIRNGGGFTPCLWGGLLCRHGNWDTSTLPAQSCDGNGRFTQKHTAPKTQTLNNNPLTSISLEGGEIEEVQIFLQTSIQ